MYFLLSDFFARKVRITGICQGIPGLLFGTDGCAIAHNTMNFGSGSGIAFATNANVAVAIMLCILYFLCCFANIGGS